MKGVEPPRKKAKQTHDQKLEQGRKYDQTDRERKSLNKWQQEFPWLSTDSKSDGKERMTCSWCIEFKEVAGKTSFTEEGSTNIRKEALTKHAKSNGHKRAAAKRQAENAPAGSSQAEKMLQQINKKQFDRLKLLFLNAHAMGKKGRPFTDFVWLCELDEQKGLDIGATYRNDKKAREFMHYIAEVPRQNLISKIKQTGTFMCIIVDGSTDCSITEQEIMYLRLVYEGVIQTHFLSVESSSKADAQGIFRLVKQALTKQLDASLEEIFPKMTSLGSDGAAVMLGKRGGLVKLLQDLQPSLIGVHCLAHRLELCFKKVIQGIPSAHKVNSFLLSLYLFYHNSPLNRSNLKQSFENVGQPILIPTRVGGTRWLPHIRRALDHLLRGYAGIVQHLGQVTILYLFLVHFVELYYCLITSEIIQYY